MRILIARTDRIGDVAISTPVIEVLRKEFRLARIEMCVRPQAAGIIEDNPQLDGVFVFDKAGRHSGPLGILRFIIELAMKRFDVAVILHPTAMMNISCFLAGIPKRIGYDRKCGFLLTDRLPHDKQEGKKHELEYTLDVVRKMGIKVSGPRIKVYLSKKSEENAAGLLKSCGIDFTKKLIAVHPGSSCRSKKWPVGNFIKTIRMLGRDNMAYQFIVLGDTGCSEEGKKIAEETGAVDLTAKTHTKALAAVIKQSALLISNDSGPVHVAVGVGTPVIAIFGRNQKGLSAKRWGPLGVTDVVMQKDAGCPVCLAHECIRDFKCLEAVTPEEVAEAASRLLR